MDDFIKEIKDNLTRKNYLSALALALILPDICGKIAYPDMKHKNGRPDIGGRYAKWYDEYIYKYDNPPGLEDQENLINPLNGAAVYKLRCNFLHDGSNDIEEFLKKESTEDYSGYRFIFTDSITKFIKQWESGIENQKNIDIQINIVDFCNHLYWAAEPFYKKHSKETILKNIIFSFSEGEY